MNSRNTLGVIVCLAFVASAAAGDSPPMTATVRVSGGSLYDYVVIGVNPRASDDFDNAYDTISPGNLNEDMGEPFISTVIVHPEWARARVLKGDLRAPSRHHGWKIKVRSNLARGTPLTVDLQQDRTTLPKGAKLTVVGDGQRCEPLNSTCSIGAPGPGRSLELSIVTEQLEEEKP